MATSDSSSLTYRERHVDNQLDDYDRRISRLEKATLIGAGYAFSQLPELGRLAISII